MVRPRNPDYRARVHRKISPPRLITVDMFKALPALTSPPHHDRGRSPLWLYTNGLRVEPIMPGELLAWVRFQHGHWVAKIRVYGALAHQPFEMIQWVDPEAIRPA